LRVTGTTGKGQKKNNPKKISPFSADKLAKELRAVGSKKISTRARRGREKRAFPSKRLKKERGV